MLILFYKGLKGFINAISLGALDPAIFFHWLVFVWLCWCWFNSRYLNIRVCLFVKCSF